MFQSNDKMYLVKDKKSPFYQILYFDDGVRKKKSTREIKKSNALIFLGKFKKDQGKKSEIKPVRLSQFKQEYLNLISAIRSQSYYTSIKYTLELFENYFGDMKLNQFDSRILEQYLISIYKDRRFTAFLYYRILRAAFNKAIEWGYLVENPFKKFKLPRIPKTIPAFIDQEQLEKIIEQTASPVMKDIFLFAFHTGMRIREIVNVKWNAIDLQSRFIKVEISKTFMTKNKQERIIPINQVLFDLLKRRISKVIDITKEDYFFINPKGVRFNIDHVSKTFKKAVRAAKLDDRIHFHTLRHSFASCLVQRGVSIAVIKDLLGHEDITTTMIYSHMKRDNLFEAVRLLEQVVSNTRIAQV